MSLRKFRNSYVVQSNACVDFFYFLARIVSLPPRLCILSYNFVNTWATRYVITYTLFVFRHSCSSIYITFSTDNRSFLPVCFPSSLESILGFSSSTTHSSLNFCLTESFEWHFFHRFYRLTTLIIRRLFTLSFQAENFLPQILPTVAFFFFFGTDSTDSPDCLPILLNISVSYFLK